MARKKPSSSSHAVSSVTDETVSVIDNGGQWDYDIFISYNRSDQLFVDYLERVLALSGLRCFRDVSGIDIFDKLDATLKQKIAKSRWLMAIISSAYLQSYWCMFEALEALQGQDLSLRFLPVSVQKSDNDQTLSEDFVFAALNDLREQIRELQSKIISTKAFALAEKLDKLSFVQLNLPKVFTKIHERVYPSFKLWDENAVRKTLRDLLRYCKSPVWVDLDAVAYVPGSLVGTPVIFSGLQKLPVVLWKTKIGIQAWKNNVVSVGNDILVPTCGLKWNKPDKGDGIVCLHAETGKVRWFASTPADANGLLVSKGLEVTGCDDGTVVAVQVSDGKRRWASNFGSGIVGGPIKLSSNASESRDGRRESTLDPLLIVTYRGDVLILDLTTGETISSVSLGGEVLAEPGVFKVRSYHSVVVPMCNGTVRILQYDSIYLSIRADTDLPITYTYDHDRNRICNAELSSTPRCSDGIVVICFCRGTYDQDPPIVAFDTKPWNTRWFAHALPMDESLRLRDSFGNIRSAPVIVRGEVIFVTAYSGSLDAVSLHSGEFLWSVKLGQQMFEQWSGPVVSGNSIFISRHDGYVHNVDLDNHKRKWSIFLGDSLRAGTTISGEQELPEFNETGAWISGSSSPILATPTIDRGRLYVGTGEGWLYCIGNLDAGV